ncbi:MAG: hypothetical protein IKA02_01805 [Clostridia bacterium]|nr:hypothetical protein [Clostridia bacterium]
MLLYILIISISTIIIISANFFASGNLDLNNLLWLSIDTITGVIAIIAWDGLMAFLIRRLLPMSWFAPGKKVFQVSKKEKKFYQFIKIKSWKDKIPELGGFTNFHKNELTSSNDVEYLKRFITESNYGVIIHIENALLGFLIFLIPLCSKPSIWIPIFAVNFILSMLPVFVLRYVTYTLNRLYEKQTKTK